MLKFKMMVIAKMDCLNYFVFEPNTINELFTCISFFQESSIFCKDIKVLSNETMELFNPFTEQQILNTINDNVLVIEGYDLKKKFSMDDATVAIPMKFLKSVVESISSEEKVGFLDGEGGMSTNALLVGEFDKLPSLSAFLNSYGGDILNYILTGEDFIKYRYLYDCTVEFIEKFGEGDELPQVDSSAVKDAYTENTKASISILIGILGDELDDELRHNIMSYLKINSVH